MDPVASKFNISGETFQRVTKRLLATKPWSQSLFMTSPINVPAWSIAVFLSGWIVTPVSISTSISIPEKVDKESVVPWPRFLTRNSKLLSLQYLTYVDWSQQECHQILKNLLSRPLTICARSDSAAGCTTTWALGVTRVFHLSVAFGYRALSGPKISEPFESCWPSSVLTVLAVMLSRENRFLRK